MAFPLFGDLTNIPVEMPSLLVFGGVFCLYPSAFKNAIFRWFVIYALILMIYVFLGKPLTIGIGTVADNKKIFIEFAYILPSVAIMLVLLYLKDLNLYKIIAVCSLLFLVISFIYIIPLLSLSANIMRSNAVQHEGEALTIPGLPGYGLMHAYVLLIPSLCYGVRYSRGKQRMILLVLLSLFFYIVLKTAITTTILIATFIVFYSLIYSERNRSSALFVMSFLFVMLYLFYILGGFLAIVDWIFPFFDGTSVESKLYDFRQSLMVGHIQGGTMTARQNLQQQSWDSFFVNPIFGGSKVGGHSNFVDRLGGMGLFVFVPFFMIVYSYYKQMKSVFISKSTKSFYNIGIIVCFILFYMKGNWGDSNWLFMFVLFPATLLYLEDSHSL